MRRALMCAAAVSVAAACPGFLVGPDAQLDRVGVFDYVWQDLDRHYAHFGVKGVDWDSLHDVYAPQAAQAPTDADLAEVVGAMLVELRDYHVDLLAGRRRIFYHDSRAVFFDTAVVSQYLADRRPSPSGHMVFGHAAPDIGYVWILTFAGSGFDTDMDAAFARFADTRALIVDVRQNPGGRTENVETVAAKFADRERTYGFLRFRDGPRHDDFTPVEPQRIAPARGRRFTGPVAVLANRRSGSAAEVFVLAMRSVPTVTIVGDSTAGGSGSALDRELPNGWTYRFPISIWFDANRAPFEEVGLAPHVWVRGSAEELADRRDAALDTALAVLRRALP